MNFRVVYYAGVHNRNTKYIISGVVPNSYVLQQIVNSGRKNLKKHMV